MSRPLAPPAAAQPMHLLACCPYYPPHMGGLERYAQELHEQLAARGHTITVLTANIPTSAPRQQHGAQQHIDVHRLPARELVYNYPWPRFTPAARQTIRRILAQPYDAVLSTTRFFVTSPLAGLIARRRHIPWLHIEHGSDYVTSGNPGIRAAARLYDETIGRQVLRRASAIITPSQSAAAFVRRLAGRPATVIYRGLPHAWLTSIAPAPQTIPADTCHIVYAGRFIDGKGLPDLLRAMSLLPNHRLRLTLAGSGRQAGSLQALAKKLQLGDTVAFTGSLRPEESIALIKSADIIVNPSYNEGLPTLILEAAACGKAIIATAVGGTPEIVTDGISACLIPPGEMNQLARSIDRLAAQPLLRRQLGQAAAAHVRQKFNWETAADAYEQVLWQVVKRTHAP